MPSGNHDHQRPSSAAATPSPSQSLPGLADGHLQDRGRISGARLLAGAQMSLGAVGARLGPTAHRVQGAVGARLGPTAHRAQGAVGARLGPTAHRAQAVAGAWLRVPGNPRLLGLGALAALAFAGVMLPPIELGTRLTSIGYDVMRPGSDGAVVSRPPGAILQIPGQALGRAARVKLQAGVPLARDLPAGHDLVGPAYGLSVRGARPSSGHLVVRLPVDEAEAPFIDPYGWDGHRWRWLPISFPSPGVASIPLPLETYVPSVVALTRATEGSSRVSAVLLPPPSVVPAAVAELPVLEMLAYHLAADDGTLSGQVFPVPARPSGRYAVIDNIEGPRVRSDLVNNMLTLPASRRHHREAIYDAVRGQGLAGVVLDYRGIAGDLQPMYAAWVGRLASDLHRLGAEVIVVVPMPRPRSGEWDPSPYEWRDLGAAADGLRVALPAEAPLELDALDAMVRWALRSVERRRLQLGIPVHGVDVSDVGAASVSFGDALGLVLDMAQSGAPRRIDPGRTTQVELSTLRAAGLTRDPSVGKWRFTYWDSSRRPHTVWLNDAAGLAPAFQIASRYRLGGVALVGVEAGLDPALWVLVKGFRRDGTVSAPVPGYQLAWSLSSAVGAPLRQALQSLDDPVFRFRAPEEKGTYHLAVDLVTSSGALVAPGRSIDVQVAPPPPPTPTPTPQRIVIEPTRRAYATRPPPPDEINVDREPVKANVTPRAVETAPDDAVLGLAEGVIRDGPGTDFPVLGHVRRGDRFDLLGQSVGRDWFRVRINSTGLEGWILGDFLDVFIDPADLPTISVATPLP